MARFHIFVVFIYSAMLLRLGWDVNVCQALPQTIKIGALIDINGNEGKLMETTYRHAVERLNRNNKILPNYNLALEILHVPDSNSFHATKSVCKLLKEGIVGIIGPSSPQCGSHVQTMCEKFGIPHIEVQWDFKHRNDKYMINFYPDPETLGKAYVDLVNAWKWEKYVILYGETTHLLNLQSLIKMASDLKQKFILRQLPQDNDFRDLLREISHETEAVNIVLAASAEQTNLVLLQAQQVGILNYRLNFILTVLDLNKVDVESFKHSGVNITSFRLVDPNHNDTKEIMRELLLNKKKYIALELKPKCSTIIGDRNVDDESLKTEMPVGIALIYDALTIFAKSLHALDGTQRINIRALDCNKNESWSYGVTILNYIKMVPMHGITGLIDFNNTGFRTDISLDVISLTTMGIDKLGTWNPVKYPKSKFLWNSVKKKEATTMEQNVRKKGQDVWESNQTIIIETMLKEPYFRSSKREILSTFTNTGYEGYVVDFAKLLSEKLGFSFIIKPFTGIYGRFNMKTGDWEGLIKEVTDRKVDMAIADLTITRDRLRAVDFTIPFMFHGVSILYTAPKPKMWTLFSVLKPISWEVWCSIWIAFLLTSLLMFILTRVSPVERTKEFYPCREIQRIKERDSFGFWMSILNTLGSLTNQKPLIYPKGISTRLLTGFWWFFTLIILAFYSANLTASLIVPQFETTIENIEDLTKTSKIKYGCVNGGSTMEYFQNSHIPVNRVIWQNMLKMIPNPVRDSEADGVEEVLKSNGKYAFFMEFPGIEYYLHKKCGLAQVGGLINNIGYGIALPKGSPLLSKLNQAILELQEKSELEKLKRKWWKNSDFSAICPELSPIQQAQSLRITGIGGIFFILIAGCFFAMIVGLCEFCWNARKITPVDGVSRKHEMKKDLQFALKSSSNIKVIERKLDNSVMSSNEYSANPTNDTGVEGTAYLDLGMNSYGFPKFGNCSNGGTIPRGGSSYK